jgi:hypothetical protein
MGLRMECMCLQCGISHYVPLDDISMEVIADFEYPLVVNMFCNQCGGMLFVVGKEGDQPRYVTG